VDIECIDSKGKYSTKGNLLYMSCDLGAARARMLHGFSHEISESEGKCRRNPYLPILA
jgi:hypothetical protein